MRRNTGSIKERFFKARLLEKQEDLQGAAEIYKGILSSDAFNTDAYNRLMIIYRRQRKYRDELAIIRQAIRSFKQKAATAQQEWKRENRKAAMISRELAQSLGLLAGYEDPQVTLWRKRNPLLKCGLPIYDLLYYSVKVRSISLCLLTGVQQIVAGLVIIHNQ